MRPLVQLEPKLAPRRQLQVVAGAASKVAPAAVSIRRARLDDVEAMFRLLDTYARQGLLLPRRIQDVYRNVREFVVAVDENDRVLGCSGLRIYTPVLGEIIALAVDERCQGQGVGRRMVETLLQDARAMDLCRVFAMTLQPVFFEKLGFDRQHIALFPEKIAIDCSGCAKRATCVEITMMLDL
ncbi:MAG: GNAT family N-acetyltransferase [Longimicrobiales bacterium]